MTIEYRALTQPLELREDGDGRTLSGVFMPFDDPTDIGGRFTEVFRRGAFTKTLAERFDKIKVYAKHDHKSFPIGKVVEAREEAHGLVGAVRISETQRGEEALVLAREGLLGFSVGFHAVPGKDVRNGRNRELREVKLVEVSLTEHPAYENAQVLAIREEQTARYAERLASIRAGNPFRTL